MLMGMLPVAYSFLTACLVVVASSDLMGPIWGEDGSEDAGATPGSSQPIKLVLSGGTATPLQRIVGLTSSAAILSPDTVDMYEVQIDAPEALSLTTDGSSFDTMLFLFRRVELPNGDVVALPVVANDNASQQSTASAINRPAGQSIPGLTAGRHFLAVATRGSRALGVGANGQLEQLFEFPANDGTGLAYPIPGLANTALVDWTVNDPVGGGYNVNVGGGIVAERPVRCDEAPLLLEGEHAFGNPMPFPKDAIALGIENPCGIPGYIFSPSWFRVGGCEGTITIDICATTGASSPYGLIVFRGGCDDLQPVACAVDSSGSGDCVSRALVSFASEGCSNFLVAFGPTVPPEGGKPMGSEGLIVIDCAPVTMSADLNGDGVVNGMDLCIVLAQWTGGQDGDDDHDGDDGNDDDDDRDDDRDDDKDGDDTDDDRDGDRNNS